MRRTWIAGAFLVVLAVAAIVSAQAPQRLVRFGGTVHDARGGAVTGVVTISFAIFAEQEGGAPLWSESQQVALDAVGRYAVLLGATERDGLPLDLFASGAARWLGVHVSDVTDAPRVLLVGVPYAVKAADADTVGGKPLSAFVLAGDKTGVGADGLTYVDTRVLASGMTNAVSAAAPGASGAAPGGAGSANFIGRFSDATTLVNSVMYQSGTGIGVNTTAPQVGFHAVSASSPVAYFDVFSNALGSLPMVYRAARGTPAAPAAVQVNDILGGLAVRGYGATGFSQGRGQVMYKAAENWTDSANGTYLQFTTTPLGSAAWAERMRIDPAGNVGIGTDTPAQKLSVAGSIQSTTGGFVFPDGTTQATAALQRTGGVIAASTAGATPAVTLTQSGTGQGLAVTSTYSDAVHAESTNGGFGVYGKASGGDGVRGEATNARGVMGWSTNSIGVYGLTDAANSPAAGVQGSAHSAAYGVYAYNSGNGYGLYAQNVGTGSAARFSTGTQAADGVQIISSPPAPYSSLDVTNGTANSTAVSASTGAGGTALSGSSDSGIGVFGLANAASGHGVVGSSGAGQGVHGYTMTGLGVYAWANDTGTGLHAKSRTGFGAKIESGATAAQTNTYALWATNTAGGTAAHFDTAGAGYAVWASNNAAGGTSILTQGFNGGDAVVAMTDTGTGVIGSASGAGMGVYGEAPAAGYAGYFWGRVNVIGTLSKSAGSFKIDHPLDPERKYLSHSFVESPDMKNMYDGMAVLDAAGEAWVTLPDYFEALNKDFRYQLTPIGAAFVPYVAEEVAGNRFKIAGGPAGKKVSWQVTGTRHDPYAAAHPIVVEEAKPADEVGTYLVPEVYGQPPEKAAGRVKAGSGGAGVRRLPEQK